MKQKELFHRAPIVRLGTDVRVKVGNDSDSIHEMKAQHIEAKLSYANPALKKLRTRLISTMRTIDRNRGNELGNRLYQFAMQERDHPLEFGDIVRAIKNALFGSPKAKVPSAHAGRMKRAAGIMFKTSHEPQMLYACHRDGDMLVIPRGGFVYALFAFGDPIYDDQRMQGTPVTFKWRGPEPRPYQVDASDFTLKRDGMTVMPCGAGKTIAALHAVARVGRRTVVLVPSKEIRNEWTKEIWKCLGIAAGQAGDGKYEPDCRITIVIEATAKKLNDARFAEVFGAAGVLIVDECHHAVAPGNRAVIDRVAAALRWGLTATPFREDGRGKELEWIFGPMLSEVTQQELVKAGYLMLPKVRMIPTGWKCPDDIDPSENYNAMMKALVANDIRNRMVYDYIVNMARKHSRILVLTTRQCHATKIAHRMTWLGMNEPDIPITYSVTEETPKGVRQDIMVAFKNGDAQVVCAVNIADEGLDIPELDCVIIAGPVKAKAKSIQRLGRLMRPVNGKEPELYDFADMDVPQLKRQWFARRRAYREVLGVE